MIEGFEIKLVPTEAYGRATVSVQIIVSHDDQPQTPIDIFTDVITAPGSHQHVSLEQWVGSCLNNLQAYLERQVTLGQYHTLGDLMLTLTERKEDLFLWLLRPRPTGRNNGPRQPTRTGCRGLFVAFSLASAE